MENNFNHEEYRELVLAVQSGNTNLAQKALDSGLSVNYQNEKGYSLVHLAAKCHQHEMLRLLKKNGADFNLENHIECNPIHTLLLCQGWEDMTDTMILLTELGSRCNCEAYDLAEERGVAYIFD